MEFQVKDIGNWLIVELRDELTLHFSQEVKALAKFHLKNNKNLLFELSKLTDIDEVGVSSLVYCQELLFEHGLSMRISSPADKVKLILQITRAYEILDIYDDLNIAADLDFEDELEAAS